MIGRQSREVEAMQPGRKETDPVLGRIRLADGIIDRAWEVLCKVPGAPVRPVLLGMQATVRVTSIAVLELASAFIGCCTDERHDEVSAVFDRAKGSALTADPPELDAGTCLRPDDRHGRRVLGRDDDAVLDVVTKDACVARSTVSQQQEIRGGRAS
jgi:hypothetical protein